MADLKFLRYRNEVISSLNKFNVAYKLVGGCIVQLIDSNRNTSDLDLLVRTTRDNTDRLILALVDCGFGTLEELKFQIYGGALEAYNSYELKSSNVRWLDYHIDMCFQLGKFNFEDSPSEVHITSQGLKIYSVPFRYIAHMKANVFPHPRQNDLKDIAVIADYLGLDPSTGLPRKDKKKRRKK